MECQCKLSRTRHPREASVKWAHASCTTKITFDRSQARALWWISGNG